ncbi:hypothetical protein [Streptomyces sp. NPDC056723]|uniref:hypothetical protein n=1 Tax=Streptomyces sp. NPDC056723 TaxID=3345925 RepID=UPI0036C9E799
MTTTDEAIREAKNRWARRRRRLIGYGQWRPFTEAEPVRQHVLAIKTSGMGLRCLSKLTGVSIGSLEHLLYGKDEHPPAVKIRTENAEALLDFWPTLDDYEDRVHIDGTGTRRRIQALAMAGWPSAAIREHLGDVATGTVEKLRTRTKVTARLARAVRDFYNQVSTKTAEEFGVTPWIANRTRTYAARHNWVMAAAWDDDTIDDPNAAPDWTGVCGTDRGWWMHTLEGIPVCKPCETAHAAWLAERRHLPSGERFRQLALAKADASHREANVAHDARELIRVSGLDYQQAAERLGVTRQHLQQALVRHPETMKEAA